MSLRHLYIPISKYEQKPYKVWNQQRNLKKGIMASSLEELMERSRHSLNYCVHDASEYKLVLEECGTEVTTDVYFQRLPSNTIFLLIHSTEKWTPRNYYPTNLMDQVV